MATVANAPANPARHLTELTLDFLAYLELERGLSRNTLEAYRSDLAQFGAFLERERLGALDVTHRQLTKFVTQLASGGPEKPAGAPAPVHRHGAGPRSLS